MKNPVLLLELSSAGLDATSPSGTFVYPSAQYNSATDSCVDMNECDTCSDVSFNLLEKSMLKIISMFFLICVCTERINFIIQCAFRILFYYFRKTVRF